MNTLYVIDASGYLYRSYFAIKGMTNGKGQSTNALFGFIRSLMKLQNDFDPKKIVAVFDGPKGASKRKAIYAPYKAHRLEMPADLRYQIEWAQRYCDLAGISKLVIPEVEADDTMGSLAKWSKQHNIKVYLCTSDKDMAQCVDDGVQILNTHKENLILGPKEVQEQYGVRPDQVIDWLAIMGDSSDNVPGIPGFGPKKATTLLEKFGSLEEIYNHLDELKSQKERQTLVDNRESAEISKQLATIDTDVPVPEDPSFYTRRPVDLPHLKQFYTEMNFHSLIKELNANQTEKEQELSYQLIDDEQELDCLMTYLSKQRAVCLDTETTSTRPLEAELVGIGFCVEPTHSWYVPVNGALGLEKVLKKIQPLLSNRAIGFYGHNFKYDLHVLANYNLKVANVCFDTILASYILNSQGRQHNLDALSLDYFGKVKIATEELIGKGKNQVTMREVPIEKVAEYCCEDVDYTARLKLRLEKELKERGLEKLNDELELPLMKVLFQMEQHGIFADVDYLHTLAKEVNGLIEGYAEEIYALAGEEINLNSPKQVGTLLFETLKIPPPPKSKTKTGYSTSADVLEALAGQYPIVQKILDYRTVEKLRSTYLEALPNEVNPRTHRIHPTFNQSVAATGRLSCQDPNLQNIPLHREIGKKIRGAFRPQLKGWSYLAADYSQIELRLLAHLSGDPTLVAAFNQNEDIHAHTASVIYGIPIDQVTSDLRYRAKAVNFGVLYGQGAYGLSRQLGISFQEAAAFIKTYFERYSHVQQFLEACKEQARTTGKAVTLIGRERAIPEINSKNDQIRSAAERLAINTPLQGTAADIIKLAMLKVDSEFCKCRTKGYMILQIHDELIFEVPDEEIDSLKAIVRTSMEEVVPLKVPLIVDISLGKNWKEC